MDASTAVLYESLGLSPRKDGTVTYDLNRMKKIDLMDGRNDGKITEDNAWAYLDKNRGSEIIALTLVKSSLARQVEDCSNSDEQVQAAKHIETLKLSELIPNMIKTLHSFHNDKLSVPIIKALGAIRTKEAITEVSQYLRSKGADSPETSECTKILSGCGDKGNYEIAHDALTHVKDNPGWIIGYDRSLSEKAAAAVKTLEEAHYGQK